MAKYIRGDTFPLTVNYEGYTFETGDIVTAGFFSIPDNEETGEYTLIKEISIQVQAECDEVQLEFSREDMYNIFGDVLLEIRTITAEDTEMTIQKKLSFGKDGLR